MNETSSIKDFYDYLRYSISMVQYNLPAVVIEDIKMHLSEYIDNMSQEELEKVTNTLDLFEEYHLKSYNVITELKNSIGENPYSEEISSVFREELSSLSVKLEKLDFISNFIASIDEMIDARIDVSSGVKKHV